MKHKTAIQILHSYISRMLLLHSPTGGEFELTGFNFSEIASWGWKEHKIYHTAETYSREHRRAISEEVLNPTCFNVNEFKGDRRTSFKLWKYTSENFNFNWGRK